MPVVNVRLAPSDYKLLVVIARKHGGNLSYVFRVLLQNENMVSEIRKQIIEQTAELRAALIPITEANEAVLKNQADLASATQNNFGVVLEAITKKR